MNRLLTLLAVKAALIVGGWAESRHQDYVRARDERGSVTVEHVLWAVAVVVIVGVVVAAIKAYVTSQSGNLK